MNNLNKYRKFLVAITATIAMLSAAMGDNTITPQEWIGILISFIGALGVFFVKNVDEE